MRYIDVAFPLKIDRLTYSLPAGMEAAPGDLVVAEVKKSLRRGIVLGPAAGKPLGKIKDIHSINPPGLGAGMGRLLSWMADYYFSPAGMVAKTVFPAEFFEPVKARRSRKERKISEPFEPYSADDLSKSLSAVNSSVQAGGYRAFLLQAPSTIAELSFAVAAARAADGNVIVVAPEHDWIEHIEGSLREAVGEDALVTYHAGKSAGRRSEAIDRMRDGSARVVLAGRYGVFAPILKPSLIIVLNEESPWYKEEGGVRYHARDMAVMRAYLEGATVVLSSIAPSVESTHNAMKGKYERLEIPARRLRPKVRVVKLTAKTLAVSLTLKRAARKRLEKGEKVLVYVNRKGFSTLECGDCGSQERCGSCDIPMVLYKQGQKLHCPYCGKTVPPPSKCPSCGGYEYRPIGTGLERVEEEIAALDPVGVDKGTKSRIELIAEGESGLAVGTKVLTRSPELSGAFSFAGVINPDAYRFIPDFRSAERAMQDLMYVADRVRPGGEIMLQNRGGRPGLLDYLRSFNLRRFYEAELKERESAGFPPFEKLVLIVVEGEADPDLGRIGFKRVEVLGPVEAIGRRGKRIWKILLKAPTHSALKPAVEGIKTMLKGRKFYIDVDPVVV